MGAQAAVLPKVPPAKPVHVSVKRSPASPFRLSPTGSITLWLQDSKVSSISLAPERLHPRAPYTVSKTLLCFGLRFGVRLLLQHKPAKSNNKLLWGVGGEA